MFVVRYFRHLRRGQCAKEMERHEPLRRGKRGKSRNGARHHEWRHEVVHPPRVLGERKRTIADEVARQVHRDDNDEAYCGERKAPRGKVHAAIDAGCDAESRVFVAHTPMDKPVDTLRLKGGWICGQIWGLICGQIWGKPYCSLFCNAF